MLRYLYLCVLVGAAAVVVGCGGGNITPLPPQPVKVTIHDDKFEPNLLTGTVNQPMVVTLENQGAKPHSFVIDELQIKTAPIDPGKTAIVTVLAKQIRTYSNGGAYIFYSDIAGDKAAGLTGNLTFNP